MDGERNRLMSEMLTDKGIATLCINLPGHGEGEDKSYSTLKDYTISQGFEAVEYLVKWLKSQKRFKVDLQKLSICGASLGGTVAIHALAKLKDFKAGVLVCTRTGFQEINDLKFYNFKIGEVEDFNYEMLPDGKATDYVSLLKNINQPTLRIHGTLDGSVKFKIHAARIKRHVKNLKWVNIRKGDHVMRDRVCEVSSAAANFLIKKLKS